MPRLPEDFGSAALRHWEDAEFLSAIRAAASDHHIGIAAECAIKDALKKCEVGIKSPYREHINVLWTVASQGLDPSLFPDLCSLLRLDNPFEAWSIEDRYAETTALKADIASRMDDRRHLTGLLLQCVELIP